MADPVIKLTGYSELVSALRRASTDTRRLDKEMAEAGQDWLKTGIIPRMKGRAPVRSGRLRDSVRSTRTTRAVRLLVGSEVRVPYAGPINFGWPARNIAAQEFIYSTLEDSGESWERSYVEALDNWLSEAFPEGRL